MVPNNAHFIWVTGEKSRAFSYINFLAVLAAAKRRAWDHIYMHTNQPPVGNANWDRAREFFEVVPLDVPTEMGGTPLRWVQYQADVCRLKVLLEHGGVYIDTDMLLTDDLEFFMQEKLSLATESPTSISNAIMASEPRAQFLQIWLDSMPEALKSPVWAYAAVVLPQILLQKHRELADVFDQRAFFPFNLEKNWLLAEDEADIEWCASRMLGNFGIHAYETFFCGQFDHVNDAFMRERDCTLTRQFGKLLDE